MRKNVRYADVESAIPCRSVPLSRSPFLSLLVHVLYILISRQRYRALYSSAPTLTVVRYDSEHVHTHRHALTHMYTYIATRARAFTRPRRIAADTHAFCNETVQITAARTAMHVIMNAGRLFVSVPSAGNIGHFEFSIFNALVSPFGPLLLSHRPFPPLPSPLPAFSLPSAVVAAALLHLLPRSVECTSRSYTKERRVHWCIIW